MKKKFEDTLVECEICKCLLKRDSAYTVYEEIDNASLFGVKVSHYCHVHMPFYDTIKYNKGEVSYHKNGRKINKEKP
jgi:hypothetical protein